MTRAWSIVFGIGLGILWLVGLSTPGEGNWLTWLTGIAALGSFILAVVADPASPRRVRAGGAFTLSAGLFVLWIAGLAAGAQPYMAWWDFAFACGYLILGVSANSRPSRRIPSVEEDRIEERPPRRVA